MHFSSVFAITERRDMGLYEMPLSMSLLDFGMETMFANFHMCDIMLVLRAVFNMFVRNASPRGPMRFRCLMFSCELLFLFVLFPLGLVVSVMLYPCILCVALLIYLFVLYPACLIVFGVWCLCVWWKQFTICLGVVVILLLDVMKVFIVCGGVLLDNNNNNIYLKSNIQCI